MRRGLTNSAVSLRFGWMIWSRFAGAGTDTASAAGGGVLAPSPLRALAGGAQQAVGGNVGWCKDYMEGNKVITYAARARTPPGVQRLQFGSPAPIGRSSFGSVILTVV